MNLEQIELLGKKERKALVARLVEELARPVPEYRYSGRVRSGRMLPLQPPTGNRLRRREAERKVIPIRGDIAL